MTPGAVFDLYLCWWEDLTCWWWQSSFWVNQQRHCLMLERLASQTAAISRWGWLSEKQYVIYVICCTQAGLSGGKINCFLCFDIRAGADQVRNHPAGKTRLVIYRTQSKTTLNRSKSNQRQSVSSTRLRPKLTCKLPPLNSLLEKREGGAGSHWALLSQQKTRYDLLTCCEHWLWLEYLQLSICLPRIIRLSAQLS